VADAAWPGALLGSGAQSRELAPSLVNFVDGSCR